MMTTTVLFRISKALQQQLDAIAKETKRSPSYIIQKALESYIEEYSDLQIAFNRLHDTTDPTISSKELRKSLGLKRSKIPPLQ